MLSCSIWFSAPSFWMGGGLESSCVGRCIKLAFQIISFDNVPPVSFRSRYKLNGGIGQICQWNTDPKNARVYDCWHRQFVRQQSACRYVQCRIMLSSSHLASQQRRFLIPISTIFSLLQNSDLF